jgi:hypothetical protein
MAHSIVTVCVAVAREQPVADAVARALAPFDMTDDSTGLQNGRWDEWRINGVAATPGLPVRAGWERDPRIVLASEPPQDWGPGRCDGAPRGLLDFEADRTVVRREAETEWAQWQAIASRYPQARPVSEFLSRHRADPEGYPLEAARRDHRRQPVIQAYTAARGHDPEKVIWNESNDPVYRLGYDREDFLRRRVARVIPTAELLRLDGTWIDYGDFLTAAVDETAHDRYYIEADTYLETLPPDVYVVRVHIHS